MLISANMRRTTVFGCFLFMVFTVATGVVILLFATSFTTNMSGKQPFRVQPIRTKKFKSLKSSSIEKNSSIPIQYYNHPGFIKNNVFSKCEYKCHFTRGRSMPNTANQIVLFYGPWLSKNVQPPKKPRGQIWVLHSKESVINFFYPFYNRWKGLFNWTMNFRLDSDILASNGAFEVRNQQINDVTTRDRVLKKTIDLAWFVSSCGTPGKRELYVKNIKKNMTVDVFGGCGDKKCPRSKEGECLKNLKTSYRFYLAFENSLCRDYITEKSYKVYESLSSVIPVVRGMGKRYSRFLPPGSYIHTEDFSDATSLSRFILQLKNKTDEFLKYFQWEKHYRGFYRFPQEFCDLCRRAHHRDMYKSVYHDVNEWLSSSNLSLGCWKPNDV